MHKKTLSAVALGAMTLALSACESPMNATHEAALREQLIRSHSAYLESVAASPHIELNRNPSDVEQALEKEGRIEDIDRNSGFDSYRDSPMVLGNDLVGQQESKRVQMSLKQAIHLAARNNLDIEVARFGPAITEAQLIQAQAAFDAVFFAEFDFRKLDTPSPPAAIPGLGATQSRDYIFRTGIRKPLTTGGQVELATEASRSYQFPTIRSVDTFDSASLTVGITQPLLRNFGSNVALAEVQLNRNANRSSVEQLRSSMLDIVFQTEEAYWTLVFAEQQLRIQQLLLDRTTGDRDILRNRLDVDVDPVQYTEANAFVEQRRADLIRARQNVRSASDRLKRLIEDDNLPLSDETLIVPTDIPADVPLQYNLLDAVTNALRNRPEAQVALLQISDASIRQRVADNQLLPQLNLTAQLRYSGVGETHGDAYEDVSDGDFIDYILGVQFEQAIGNRAAKAQYRRFQLERQRSVSNYQAQARDIVLEVKEAMRDMMRAYELIGATRAARRAAFDHVRALGARMEDDLSASLVDLKLRQEGTLANTQLQEIQAMIDYNTAVARFYRATGALLDRNGIDFRNRAVDE